MIPSSSTFAAADPVEASSALTYADYADLVMGANLVVRAKITKQVALKGDQARGVPSGKQRFYIEAETQSLLYGPSGVGGSLRYLVDLAPDARGKMPKLKKREVILFARNVAGRAGEIALSATDGQLFWSPDLDQKIRFILGQKVEANAPPYVKGIRDVLSIAGNLADESETQIFLETGADASGLATISVIRRSGAAPVWGVSWTEIVDQSVKAPERGTLAWYRLACFLPATLPQAANLAETMASRRRAAEDYRFVIAQLGECKRSRK